MYELLVTVILLIKPDRLNVILDTTFVLITRCFNRLLFITYICARAYQWSIQTNNNIHNACTNSSTTIERVMTRTLVLTYYALGPIL